MNSDLLKRSTEAIISLSEAEWQQLLELFEVRILKKNDYFLKEGEVCTSIAFINRGTLIYYKLQDSGNEATTDFAFPGDWVTDNRSRLSHNPSYIHIKAIDDCELLVISNNNLNYAYQQIPKLEKLGRILIEQAFVKIAQHSIDLQTLTAGQRYEKLLHEHPEIVQQVPLYHIANFLGIAPKSLSRIRGK
ncbi:Crp/Fnr family transcriptional regulator [Parabacteroides sp. FAFU027]|uniref:Crp/Fnr family transcriptional regulator n=1 Tax=Parabacteroides sp. FAFU027 TaxID=2922715 RepID=UPI001FAF113E|nr:Crp/Fnr family transcriptional regulator [Parabacteroides sp. FAFU027]